MEKKGVFDSFKAQSAIEYLMTYGWMLLVVAIVGGAIFSMVGEQSIENVSGFENNEIKISDFGMTASSLQMNLETFGANNMELKEVRLQNPTTEDITFSLNEGISVGSNRVLNLPHLRESAETNDMDIELKYDTGGLENITASGTVTGQLQLDDDFVGYWPLSEDQANDTHAIDISQNDNQGVHETKPVTGVESPDGEGYYIQDPEHCVKIPDPKGEDFFLLEEDREWSVSYWGNKSFGDGEYYGMYLNQGSGGGTSRQWSISQRGEGSESMRVSMRGNVYDYDMSDYYAEWHHYAFVWDESEATIFIDGEIFVEGLVPGDNAPESRETFAIGGRYHCTSNEDQGAGYGQFSDLKVHERALSNTEIRSTYNSLGLID